MYGATVILRAELSDNKNKNSGEERGSAVGGSGAQPCKGWGSRVRCGGSFPVPSLQPFPCVYYRGGLGAATGARKSAAGSRGAGPRPHAIPGASGAESRAASAQPPRTAPGPRTAPPAALRLTPKKAKSG